MRISTCVLVLAIWHVVPASGAIPVAVAGDASITHDPDAGTWTLSAGGTALTLALDRSRDFQVVRLATSSKIPWTVDTLTDATVTINGAQLVFGSRASGFTLENVTAQTVVAGAALQLDATFDLKAASLRITRHYAIATGSPTFETWNTFQALGPAFSVSNLTPFQASLPNGRLHWLTGLQGDSADIANDNAFTLQETTLDVGDQFTIGAQGRSSERAVPVLAIDGADDEFYVALMWSGAWDLHVDRRATGLSLSLGLTPMTTVVEDGSIDGPHVLFGAVLGGFTQASVALRSYALPGIRDGRPLTPLVTYNTWYAHATRIDETTVRGEMLRAAALGVQLFVVDAGWYAGAGTASRSDFDTGLGSWEPDPGRFPNGLKALGDYARSFGMKFGIWVEPERVNLTEVGGSGIDERWLAKRGTEYGSAQTAQVCFAGPAARGWILDHLTNFIDTVQPDYLKWDNNLWVNCDRPGHGHGLTDGNFAHVKGLYEILSTLRSRYPNLIFENVSGGGNRLDLGMLRFTDVAWMSDGTAPSVHIRHNLQGLSAIFPPAYLLSFVIDHPDEPLHRAPDMSLYFRSRMQGALGLSFRNEGFTDADLSTMAAEIEHYKAMRDVLSAASASLLSSQAARVDGPAWDVLQEAGDVVERLLVTAVQTDAVVDRVIVKPTGLQPGTLYEVHSVDRGLLGTATGSALMDSGIEVSTSPATAAHILTITPARP